jgi:hypothetical protein
VLTLSIMFFTLGHKPHILFWSLKSCFIILSVQVFMVASMKITSFGDVVPCSVIGVDQRFKDAYCLHHQGDDGSSMFL